MELTILEAFKSMVAYLEKFYENTGSNDIGGLLSDMIFLDDGTTADPAAWNDWIECVNKIKMESSK